LYDFASDHPLDLNELRARLARMSDQALQQFGAAARYMCSAKANGGSRRERCSWFSLRKRSPSGAGVTLQM
jgi:hypothetical protein